MADKYLEKMLKLVYPTIPKTVVIELSKSITNFEKRKHALYEVLTAVADSMEYPLTGAVADYARSFNINMHNELLHRIPDFSKYGTQYPYRSKMLPEKAVRLANKLSGVLNKHTELKPPKAEKRAMIKEYNLHRDYLLNLSSTSYLEENCQQYIKDIHDQITNLAVIITWFYASTHKVYHLTDEGIKTYNAINDIIATTVTEI